MLATWHPSESPAAQKKNVAAQGITIPLLSTNTLAMIFAKEEASLSEETKSTLIALTADIVAAHVAHNHVAASDMPLLIQSVHDALARTSIPAVREPELPTPAVPIRKSVYSDYIVCLEDGKKLKMLKRHLMTRYQMTPDDYRAKWKLPSDYPMVAPNYAKQRKALALKIGLGRGGHSRGKLSIRTDG